ncbi:MAG: cysteine--tRNA ligase [Omnitrophica bacterium GWA2_41_15]|nr:MAG: cysteine--tRNA ligase [Omnitrophica bacterium GWA2_41_15]
MSIKIYNTLTRRKEEFKPLKEGNVGIYVCGPTVYDAPHIGHARSAYAFDVIRRYFIYKDYKVEFVRNVTDVDDKIINKAKEEFKGEDLNVAVKSVSDKYLKVYHDYMEKLGIMQPDVEPKATEYIEKMGNFIKILIERGVAYASGGDVYFNVRKANGYGKLSNQSFEMLESGARIAQGENKKDPLDFALWKSVKSDEPSWPSPWGNGRPGWHIECSVMSSDILGDEFDIHGGGIDLVFPHHENEAAQSEGAGKKFARYWIHNGLLTINKEKMSKSLGNFITIEDILAKYPADVLKILFLQTHYSHPVDFSWEKMDEAKRAYERIDILMKKLKDIKEEITSDKDIDGYRLKFEEVMDDDFNTAQALGIIFEIVTFINKNIENEKQAGYAKKTLIDLGKVLGLFEGLTRHYSMEFSETIALTESVNLLIKNRNKAREKKDFKEADRIRKELEEKGVILEDTKNGTTWRIK